MNKNTCILTIKIEGYNKTHSKTIVLDTFNSLEETEKYAKWLIEIYKKFKENL